MLAYESLPATKNARIIQSVMAIRQSYHPALQHYGPIVVSFIHQPTQPIQSDGGN